MSQDVDIYTETMAKVYAEQGHWAKAAKIYRYLLDKAPARHDLADALADAENRIQEAPERNSEDLVPLFRKWIELLFKHEKLQKLRKMKDKL